MTIDVYKFVKSKTLFSAPYTLITFPFLFAVMFGDCGHGLLMALFALWMVLREKQLSAVKSDNEIWTTMFGGRYIILLMGIFSIYTGFIYNDIFSKSFNIFGTGWNATAYHDKAFVKDTKFVPLYPEDAFNDDAKPYPIGIDPIWQAASNKILFLNSYKMKVSIVFGVTQMSFGVVLSLWNHVHFRRYINIFCEFIPQIIFLWSIFGYLCVLIFFKWISLGYHNSFCNPSLLITLINMFLMKYTDDPCYLRQMYFGQQTVQTILVVVAFLCVPWMLLLKPIIKNYSRHRYQVTPAEGGEEDQSFGELFIHQAIHTIEYCLGSISHTASYLRLWALSLAHAELSEVLWNMVFKIGLSKTNFSGFIIMYLIFAAWAGLTIGILLIMEGLSAFLHALRLHWVEFQSKFYDGQGHAFVPFSFALIPISSEA